MVSGEYGTVKYVEVAAVLTVYYASPNGIIQPYDNRSGPQNGN